MAIAAARSRTCPACWAGLVFAAALTANAASFVWDGGHAALDNWSLLQNWNPNGTPANDGTSDLVFTGTVRLAPDANGTWDVNSITFNSFAGAFTVVGDSVTLRGTSVTSALANNSSYAASLSNALVLGSSQTWTANTADLSLSGTIALGGNTLTLAGGSNFTASGAISGTGGLVKTGAGTATLTGANTYSGTTTVSGGTLQGSTTSLPGSIVNNASLILDQTFNGTYSGVISGTGSFTKQNTGTVTLNSVQTYTGATTVSGGSLVLGTTNTLAADTAVSVASGATLQLAGGPQTIASFAGAGGIALGSNTLTAGSSNASTEFSGTLSGTGGLVKTGTGTLTLTGTNSGWTGGTTISAGTLQGSSASLQGAIANNGAIVFDQAANGTFAGAISGVGTFTKQNTGTLTLTGTNTYTGATAISGGTLALGGANALADTTAVTVSSGATLQLASGAETIGSLAGTGNVNLGSFTLTSGGTDASTTFSGALSGSGGKLVKAGTGTLTLTGTNTHTGGTDVTGGTLQGTTSSLQGNIALSNNSTLAFDQNSSGTHSGVISGAGSLVKTNTGTLTLSGANAYTGATTISGGTLALGASNALPAATNLTLSAGATLDLAGNSVQVGTFNYTTSFVDFGAGAATNYLLFNGGGTGSGTLTISNFDAATDKLAFASSSTVDTAYLNGIYFYGIGAGTFGATGQTIAGYSGTWNLIVPNAAPFRTWDGGGGGNTNWSQKNNWDDNNVLVSGTGLKVEFAGSTSTTPNVDSTYTLNALRFASGAASFTVTASTGSSLTLDGAVSSIIQLSANAQTVNVPLALNSTTIVETTGAGTLTLGGVISGASGGINKVGDNTLVLSGANTYDGATTVNAGTVVLRHGTALGSTTGGTSVLAGATLQLENTISVGAEALTLHGTLRNAVGANSYAGAISGSGTVVVDGGSLELGGATANTYTGATNVNSGTLDLAKSGGVTALAGNLTIGNGTDAATVRLLAGNQISDASAVTLNAGTTIFQLNGFAETIGSLASTNAAAAVQLGAGSLTTGGDNASTTFAGVVSGSGSLTKQGTGTFTLSGANTYTGATTIAAGTLIASHDTALGTAAGGTVVNSGATLQLQGGIAVGTEALALGGSLVNASGANSYGGAISGGGTVTVTGGSLSLGGTTANTYTGATTVNSGTLDLNKTAGMTAVAGNLTIGSGTGTATARLLASNQIADTSAVTLTATGTPVLNLNGYSDTIGSLASTNAAAAVQLGAGTLTTGGDNTSPTFAGVISGSGGALTKAGSGTMTLTNTNTYTGATTVTGGKLVLGLSDALASSTNLTLGANTTLSLNGTSSQQVGSLSSTTATVDFGTTGTANYLLLGSVGTTSGILTISNWTSGSDVFGIATNPGTPAFLSFLDNVYFSGINVGVGAVISSTTTTVGGYGSFYTLSPIPTFTWSGGQNTGVAADMDNWSKSNNWMGGIAPGIAAVKSLVMAGSVQTTNDMDGAYQIKGMVFRSDAGAFTINSSTGDTLTVGGAGLLNQSANTQALNVPIALSASQTWTAESGNLLINGATVLNSTHTLTIDGASHTTVNAVIGNGSGGLVKNGTGTLTLTATNTFTGGVAINAGHVAITTDANLGDSTGTVTFGGGTLRTDAAISSARTMTINAGGGTLNSNGSSSTFSGVISGSGGLTKTGSGTITLTGANTYSGGTTVGAGTLQGNTTSLQGNIVNQATLVFDQAANGTYAGVISGTGAVTKQNSGVLTLTGANTYTGATTITGGTLALGLSNALASTTALTISSGATFATNSLTQTIGSLAGAGQVSIGTGLLMVGADNTSTTFGGQLSGTGVFDKIGTGSLTFNASINFAGELKLTGGTLALAGINLTLGTLRISGNTILDFGSSTASVLTATNLIIENGAILTVNNWVELQDFFYVNGALFGLNTTTMVTTPATPDVRGVPPQNQIQFNGFSNSLTVWQSYDWQVTPAPEPATYGAMFVGGAIALLALRRWKRRPGQTAASP